MGKIRAFVIKRWYLVLLVGLVLFLIGRRLIQKPDTSATNKSYTLKKQDLEDTLSFSGNVDAKEKANLSFSSVGKLSWVKVKVGETVKKGQAIAGLETKDLASLAVAAKYKYLAADANAKQIEDTVKGHDSDETFAQKNARVTAQTARDIAYDSWQIAEKNLREASLFSPITGIVTKVTADQAGVFITSPSQAVYQIVNPESIYFSALADQNDVIKLKNGQTGQITLDAYSDKQIETTIESINFVPKEGESGTVYEVILKMENKGENANYRLGMTGDVTFVLRNLKDVLVIPQRYVKVSGAKKFTTVERGGNKQKVEIEVGENIDGNFVVVSGVNEGEVVYDQAI